MSAMEVGMRRFMPAVLAFVFTVHGCAAQHLQPAPRAASASATVAEKAGAQPAAATRPGQEDRQPAARGKTPPRRAVWQDIATIPPAAAPASGYQSLPVPQPAPMPAPPQPTSFPAQCGPLGCARPDGTRLHGSGGTLSDPTGRQCVQGPVTIQCF